MTIFADATTENADWIKPAFWDLAMSADDIKVLPIEELADLVKLPSWEAAPEELHQIAERRFIETD